MSGHKTDDARINPGDAATMVFHEHALPRHRTSKNRNTMRDQIIRWGIQLAERAWLPDTLLRASVRHLCRQRLSQSGRDRQVLERSVQDSGQTATIAEHTDTANEQHYEVPAGFFELVLGPRRKYSCGYWSAPTSGLASAEETALDLTCQQAEITDGQHILDLGCGWGSLSLWIAEHYRDCQITAVSNSHSQRAYILQQAEARNLAGNIQVVTADINEFAPPQSYDRVVSIEMFEHVRNHQALLRRIAGWLRSDGKLYVHVFCHRHQFYEFEDAHAADWMTRHFFAGGVMPSADLLPRLAEPFRHVESWQWTGWHYQQTAEAWLARLQEHREPILDLFEQHYGSQPAPVWLQRWRMFFIAVAETFGYSDGTEWFVSHYLFDQPKVP